MPDLVTGFIGPDGLFYRTGTGAPVATATKKFIRGTDREASEYTAPEAIEERAVPAPVIPALEVPEVPLHVERGAGHAVTWNALEQFLHRPEMRRRGHRVYFVGDNSLPLAGRAGFMNVTSAKAWFDSKKVRPDFRDQRKVVIEQLMANGDVRHERTYERKRTAWHRVK